MHTASMRNVPHRRTCRHVQCCPTEAIRAVSHHLPIILKQEEEPASSLHISQKLCRWLQQQLRVPASRQQRLVWWQQQCQLLASTDGQVGVDWASAAASTSVVLVKMQAYGGIASAENHLGHSSSVGCARVPGDNKWCGL